MSAWRDIPGYAGFYQVSDDGCVRSMDRTVYFCDGRSARYKGRALKPSPETSGYLVVGLRKEGHNVTRKIHQLVLEAFVGPRPSGLVTRHLNGDKLDNRLSNLTYGTYAENACDTQVHGHFVSANAAKTHCIRGHEYAGDNLRVYRGIRYCRACAAITQRQRQARYRSARVLTGGAA